MPMYMYIRMQIHIICLYQRLLLGGCEVARSIERAQVEALKLSHGPVRVRIANLAAHHQGERNSF